MKKKNIVVIGGGTGTYMVLSGLKKYPVKLSAVISMMDSGGSNKILRDEFGLLPTSDIRQCLVALAGDNASGLIRKLFTYRYSQGTGISGMTFGNLFMVALTDIYGTQEKAIEKTSEFLETKGNIHPVTYDNVHLVARYANGKQVLGEHYINDPDKETGKYKIVELEVIPRAKANPNALKAIKSADLIVFGPGDLFTSVICNLVVDGVVEAIRKSKAKKVHVINLMTKFGETNGFKASDHLSEIEKYAGDGIIDYCLMNNSRRIPDKVLKKYKAESAILVADDLKEKVVRRSIISNTVYRKSSSDVINRSLIRHDSNKLAKAIMSLV